MVKFDENHGYLVGALWKMMEFVSWDDEIPNNYMEK